MSTCPSSTIQFRIPMIFWNQLASSGPRISKTSRSVRYPLFRGGFGDARELFVLLWKSRLHRLNCGLDIGVRAHIPGLGSFGQLVVPTVSTKVSLLRIPRILGSIDFFEFVHISNLLHYCCGVVQYSQQIINLGKYVIVVGRDRCRIIVVRVGRQSERSSISPRSTARRIIEFLEYRKKVLAHPHFAVSKCWCKAYFL